MFRIQNCQFNTRNNTPNRLPYDHFVTQCHLAAKSQQWPRDLLSNITHQGLSQRPPVIYTCTLYYRLAYAIITIYSRIHGSCAKHWLSHYISYSRSNNSKQLNLAPKTTCLERPYIYGQQGGLSRQVLLYAVVPVTRNPLQRAW